MTSPGLKLTVSLTLLLCLGAAGLAGYTLQHQRTLVQTERAQRKAQVAKLQHQLVALKGTNAALTGKVNSAVQTVNRKSAGLRPLAARVLRSVFTVHTPYGLGTGFVGWRRDDSSYVITAYHVVSRLIGSGVTLSRKGGSWGGELTAIDPKHDLALIRLDGKPAGAAPLWQKPVTTPPATGDALVLVGSPYGLSGTVTRGIVSRVSSKVIQTDAAANPGNSGGPALDQDGRVVGVVVARIDPRLGSGLTFAVPIKLVCAYLRKCR
jgi:S1-C subfamily serine protease